MRSLPAARLLLPILAVLAVLAASPGRAAAGSDRSVAILSVELAGDAAPELRQILQRNLRRGLAQQGLQVVPLEEVSEALSDEPQLVGCVSTECLERIGERVEAARFVRAHVEAAGAEYRVVLELYAVGPEEALRGRLERSCTVCTISELNDLVADTAAELAAEPRAAPADGASGAGGPGGPPGTSAIAPQVPAADPGHPRSPIPKWATAGGGTALLVTGAALLAVDANRTCPAPCDRGRGARSAGIAFVGIGLALGGASGWLFYRDRRAGREATATVAPTAGGAAALVQLRF